MFTVAAKMGTALLLLGYPVLIYLGLSQFSHTHLGLVLLVLFGLRVVTNIAMRDQGSGRWLGLAGLALAALYLLRQESAWLLFYPVLVNATMLVLFGASLFQPVSLIERVARLRHPTLPDAARPYLRRVTQVWVLFFIVNGSIAAWTAVAADMHLWTLYNGLISYLLMGALFAGEWLFRKLSGMEAKYSDNETA